MKIARKFKKINISLNNRFYNNKKLFKSQNEAEDNFKLKKFFIQKIRA